MLPPSDPLPFESTPMEVLEVSVAEDAPMFEQHRFRAERTLARGRGLKLVEVPDLPPHRALVAQQRAPGTSTTTTLYDTRTGEALARFGELRERHRTLGFARVERELTREVGLLDLNRDRLVYPSPTLPNGRRAEDLRLVMFSGPITWGVLFGHDEQGAVFFAPWELKDDPPTVLGEPFPFWPQHYSPASFSVRPDIDWDGPSAPRECLEVRFTPERRFICAGDRQPSMMLPSGVGFFGAGEVGTSFETARSLGSYECPARHLMWFEGERLIRTCIDPSTEIPVFHIWSKDAVVSWSAPTPLSATPSYLRDGMIAAGRGNPVIIKHWIDLKNLQVLKTPPLIKATWDTPRRILVTPPEESNNAFFLLDVDQRALIPVEPHFRCEGIARLQSNRNYGGYRCETRDYRPKWSKLVDYERRRAIRHDDAIDLLMDHAGRVIALEKGCVVISAPAPSEATSP